MKVHEFMSTKVEIVDADQSVYDAVEKMVDRRIRSVAVKFPGSDTEYGVVTSRDIVFKVLAKGINPKKIKIAQIASKPMARIDRNTDFEEAARMMEKSNFARLFVFEEGKIIGLVSLLDVMAAELVAIARGDHDS